MRKVRFSIEQVRTFVAVAETQHISQAAMALYLTQGAVTQQLRHFERALGVQLVERSGRGIRLTEAGRSVAAACSSAARSLESIEETASQYTSVTIGTLELGASPTATSHYLPAILTAFTARFPQVEIRVATSNSPTIADQVAKGVLDCGLIESPAEQPNLIEARIEEDEFLAVVRREHPLAALKRLRPGDLERHRYIAREPGSAHESVAAEILGEAHGRSRRLQVSSLDAVRACVLEGLGYAVLPRIAVAKELEDGTLTPLPLPNRSRWIRGIRRETLRSPALEEFWKVLTEKRTRLRVLPQDSESSK